MYKNSPPTFFEKLLIRTGRWYPIVILVLTQLVNTPVTILLTVMPAQSNAELDKAQGIPLLIFGIIAILVRNLLLLGQFYLLNQDLLNQLSKIRKPGQVKADSEQGKHAWLQGNSAAYKYILLEFIEYYIIVMAPTLVYGYFGLHISLLQVIQISFAAVAASLVNLIAGNLVLDQFFKPVIQALLPQQLETQLAGLKGMRIWMKLSIAIVGLAVISLLLTIPTAYHQMNHIFEDPTRSPELLRNAILLIINAGIGAIVVGVFLSIRLVSYFSVPFRKMIELFREVETGDLTRRIAITNSDEFGEVNIYLNQMIERIQALTSNLEGQVAERTEQLSQTNDKLVFELTERKRMEKHLVYSALHDSLTNLPNRVLLMDRLTHAMERARRNKNFTFSVIFMDLDGFKVINDSLGHEIGDLLLIESARRISATVRGEDTVARLGGDEFVLLIEEMDGSSNYLNITKRIQETLANASELGGHKVFISVSMGIVFSDDRYERPEDILRDADIAMYHAKRQGRGRIEIFDTEMLDSVMTRLGLETDLRVALDNQEFVLYYQPIINLGTNRIIGFEALIRWQHPTRGLTQPSEFISTAEEIGLIVPIGYWVLDEACRQIYIWQKQYPTVPPLTINVNISPRQCAEKDFVEKIVEILHKNNLDPSSLKLELSESLIVENPAYISALLTRMFDHGIQVQIGEFGTGYSLLGYLHTLPIDTLKIDRTFINRLETNDDGSGIVQTILTLAHDFGMKVIAEGVETDEQLSKLKSMDCEFVQGFLIAKPVGQRAASTLLKKSHARTGD